MEQADARKSTNLPMIIAANAVVPEARAASKEQASAKAASVRKKAEEMTFSIS